MTNQQVLDILNKKAQIPADMKTMLEKWRGIYRGISLHTQGVCPRFKSATGGKYITPVNYVDSKYQEIFDYILFSRHPREDEVTRNWRYSQYKPITKAPFTQATEIVSGAIFQDSNYNIEIPETKDNQYIWTNNFSGYDLVGYFANIGLKNIVEDPNGFFIRMPNKAFYEQVNDKVDIDVWFVNTTNVIYRSDKEVIFTKGDYAYHVDEATVFRFYKKESTYYLMPEDKDGYYAHMLGYLPITIAGGEWNTQGYFDSFFDKAKPIADDFISSYSAAQMVDKEASHPFIETIPQDCPSCSGGDVTVTCDCDHNAECRHCSGNGFYLDKCSACGGSGTQSVFPGKWLQTPAAQFKDGAIRIVNPDISINTHNRQVAADLYIQLKEALHLFRADKAESGEAKAIDQERLYQFVSNISNHLFDKIIYDTINDIIALRNVKTSANGKNQPYSYKFKIIKPTEFKIKTGEDLLNEYNEGTKANMPTVIRKRMALDYAEKAYNGDEAMIKKIKLINAIDTIGIYPQAAWMGIVASGGASTDDIIISRMLPTWLDELYEEKGHDAFLKLTNDEVRAWITPKLQASKPPVTDIEL